VSALDTSAGTLLRQLVPAFALALVAVLLLSIVLGRRLTRPVAELSQASERIARGLYDVELRTKGRDELGVLASRFEQMAKQLKEADELERNFLMRISHELRTPLTSIQGHVQAIADGIIDDPVEQEASLDVVLSEADRLQRLIGDLLDLAKLEARRFSLSRDEVDLDALTNLAVQARRESARARDVELHYESIGPCIVVGDGDRILQIVGNLLQNAIGWTPDGTTVTVTVGATPGLATVSVADCGPGVPPGQREAIFRPFVTSNDSGTGLGLSVAAELATAMGGSLAVADGPGGGALFTLVLPLVHREAPQVRQPARRTTA
jgi:two-component system sensor histidine kinase BaeS